MRNAGATEPSRAIVPGFRCAQSRLPAHGRAGLHQLGCRCCGGLCCFWSALVEANMRYQMARSACVAAVAIAVAVAAVDLALGQTWPAKPVRVIVPFSPGSATDLVPRTVFDHVAAQLGQTIIIDNRPGGGTTVGTATVARAEPDGHTLLAHSTGLVTTPAIQASLPYDPV